MSLTATTLFVDLAPRLMQGPKLKSALKTRTIPPIEAFATPRGDPGEQQASSLAHIPRILLLQMSFQPLELVCLFDCSLLCPSMHVLVQPQTVHTVPSHAC